MLKLLYTTLGVNLKLKFEKSINLKYIQKSPLLQVYGRAIFFSILAMYSFLRSYHSHFFEKSQTLNSFFSFPVPQLDVPRLEAKLKT